MNKKDQYKSAKGVIAVLAILAMIVFAATPQKKAEAQICEFIVGPILAGLASIGVTELMFAFLLNPPGRGPPALPSNIERFTHLAQKMVTGREFAPKALGAVNNIIGKIFDIPVVGTILSAGLGYAPIKIPMSGHPKTLRFGGTRYMDEQMRARMYQFWKNEFGDSLKKMTAQLAASDMVTAQAIAAVFDASAVNLSNFQHQEGEVDAIKDHMISSESCRFDTTAQTLGSTQAISRAVTRSNAKQVNTLSTGDRNSPAGQGRASMTAARMAAYKETCDEDDHAGLAPCPPTTPSAYAGWATQPSKAIFGKETVDFFDDDYNKIIKEMTLNATGFIARDTIPPTALKGPNSRQQRQRYREYAAQMNAMAGLFTMPVAERAPGPEALDVQRMRIHAGIPADEASPTPSQKEHIQAHIDQLSNSNFFVDLSDQEGTIAQKEVLYKAYNAMLLYKLIEKQEKIALAYAIETANMLHRRYPRDSMHRYLPN